MEKCKVYDMYTGKYYGRRVVYHGVIDDELGDVDL